MKLILSLYIISLSANVQAQINLDSLDKANAATVAAAGFNYLNKAIIEKDSVISLQADMKRDHRFFGYQKPSVLSRRMLLMSIFTNDVQHNPFGCTYGAYYETSDLTPKELKMVAVHGAFIKASLSDPQNRQADVYLYFERKWFRIRK